MADLIDEIKEDMLHEKYANIWKKYGDYVIGIAIAIVFATGASVFWKSYQNNKHEELGSRLYKSYVAEQIGKTDEALTGYSKLTDGSDIGPIAKFRKASALIEIGKVKEGVDLYKEVSKDSNAPIEIRDLAKIMFLQSAVKDSSSSEYNDLQKMAAGDGPFTLSAKEILAFLEYENNNLDKAENLFDALKTDNLTPHKMRVRADEMLNIISNERLSK